MRRTLLSFFIALTSCFELTAQSDPVEALKKYNDNYPQEKIYIWYNKPAYVSGETIFFKAYVFAGYDVSLVSTTLYVELYDASKKLLEAKMFPIFYGISEGSLEINNKMPEGVYYIRAYTRWMLNFDEAYLYIHPFTIYNVSSERKLSFNKSKWTAMAAPEGGVLVEGIETKVAVRRLAYGPLNSKWSGYMYEESAPEVKLAEFTGIDDNVGIFTFIPAARKKYYVNVIDEAGNSKICPLPLVKSSGVAIKAKNEGDSVFISLKFKNIPENSKGYSVLGEMQHEFVFNATLNKSQTDYKLKIPVSGFNNGILHLTVFDPLKEPVAERLIFLNYQQLKYDSSKLYSQLISVEPRVKNKLQIGVDSISWYSYAVSVIDADSPIPVQEDNILSAVWLSSDLKMPIQNPAGYFTNTSEEKEKALDALLISEKWERYDWRKILNDKLPTTLLMPDNYLSYTGTIIKGKNLKPKEEVNLILSYPDSSRQFLQALSDDNGKIKIDNLIFNDEAKIYYQLNTKKNAGKLIEINFEKNNRFARFSLLLPETPYVLNEQGMTINSPQWVNNANDMANMEKNIEGKYKVLQEVVIKSSLRSATEKMNDKLSSGLFRSINETVIDFVNTEQNAMGALNILQWLQGRVAGLNIVMEGGDYVPYIRGSASSIYIDEMRADPGLVSSLNISDIAMIKIIKGPSALLGGGGGVIAIYTARGDIRPAQTEPSLHNKLIKGYDAPKKFFSPDYGIKAAPQPDTDKRDQLLWHTSLAPQSSLDKTIIAFYNNDTAKKFRVIVQGFTESGFPVYFEKIIAPEKKAF